MRIKMAAMGAAVLVSGAMPVAAQTTLAQNPYATSSYENIYPGQSFTTPGTSFAYDNITFSFFNQNNKTANGSLYLYTSAQSVTPGNLAQDTTNLVGVASSANGVYTFPTAMSLDRNRTYYAYSDGQQTVGNSGNAYAGGTALYSNGGRFSAQSTDMKFSVSGIGTTPEPSSWTLMIVGFGIVGGTLRRQKRRTFSIAQPRRPAI